MQFQPFLKLMDNRVLSEERPQVSDSEMVGGMQRVAEEFLKPMRKDPNGFVQAYLDHTGRHKMTVRDLMNDLDSMAVSLKRQLHDSLQHEFGGDGVIVLTEGILSSIWDKLTWLGKTVWWVGEKLWEAVVWLSRSWVGSHPIGRIAICIVFLSYHDMYYPGLSGILKLVLGRFYWLFPASFILGVSLILLVEARKAVARLSTSDTIIDYVSIKRNPSLTYSQYIGAAMGMRR